MVAVERQFDDAFRANLNSRFIDLRIMLPLLLALVVLVSGATAQTVLTISTIHGTVFVLDSQGPSYVPGAKITLAGPLSLQRDTDSEGRFSFRELAPGGYTVTVQFPGLEATQTITVEPGRAADVSIELKPSEVKTHVTVTASQPQVKGEALTETISSVKVRGTPNLNERTESVLPLTPGVVRAQMDGST